MKAKIQRRNDHSILNPPDSDTHLRIRRYSCKSLRPQTSQECSEYIDPRNIGCTYSGLSKFDLKKSMLAALGELSNLRADSKSLRRRLESTRSALAEIHHRISIIQCELDKGTLIEFPQPMERLHETMPLQVETVQRKKRA